jgi:predicted transposase YbfD/YdcC
MQNQGFDVSNMVLHNRAMNLSPAIAKCYKLCKKPLQKHSLSQIFKTKMTCKTEITWNGMKIATDNTCTRSLEGMETLPHERSYGIRSFKGTETLSHDHSCSERKRRQGSARALQRTGYFEWRLQRLTK